MINRERVNARYLPDVLLDPRLVATANITEAMEGADCVLVAIPAQALRGALQEHAAEFDAAIPLVLCCKGIERATGALPSQIAEAVRTGGSLSGALKRSGIFPPLLVYLAASGEASGRLDLMLERAADYLEREFDSFTATALALLEPAIIIVMGVVVAVIVLSILLPILQLDTLASGIGQV